MGIRFGNMRSSSDDKTARVRRSSAKIIRRAAAVLLIASIPASVVALNDNDNGHSVPAKATTKLDQTTTNANIPAEVAPPTMDTTNNPAPAAPRDNVSSSSSVSSRSVSSQVNSTTVNGQTTTSVQVNGQNVPVPDNGQFHKTITDANGQTNVNISATGGGSSSVNIQVDSNSSSP